MRYSPLMSLEGIVYPIVALSLWVSLFIELKSFKIALMYATLNMGHKGTSKLSSLRTAMLLPFPGAGAAGSCWFAGWFWCLCWCCWLLGVLQAAGCWRLACCVHLQASNFNMHAFPIETLSYNMQFASIRCHNLSYTCLRGIVFWQSPIVIQGISKKPHCHEMPLLNVDDHNFDLNSYSVWFEGFPRISPISWDS